ncbi:MAG: DUF1552 domain-containing protein [Opitutaceae bacterium]|nr:DUF1552 domain-containing protein [Verrucomicrobiales bacterium]
MNSRWHIPRRTFLKGIGTAVALPMLEAMVAPTRVLAAAGGAVPQLFPKRMAFVYVPNGANMVDWTPQSTGKGFDLPFILQPLQDLRSDFQVLSGLAHVKARANGDGAGDHARANATFLTGRQARKTAGADIRAGISVDQVAAGKVGSLTRFPSLELSCDPVRQAGSCDSGYSCAYQFNIAWKSDSTPLPPEANPRLVFERLFSGGADTQAREARLKRERYNKSILDFVLEDARQLRSNLGLTDQRKLDEYLAAVREIELRIEREEKFNQVVVGPEFKKPVGIPSKENYANHIRMMYDLMVLAFQTDTTRISTFMVAHDGSNRSYPFIGVSDGHHDLSHHGQNEDKKKKIAQINRFHVEQYAYFLNKLKGIKEGGGSLLDNCMIVYGSGIADGNSHAHHDLPVLLAGRGGGTLTPGRHLKFPKETPMCNLYFSMLSRMGVGVDRFGDSNGKLEQVA